MLMLCDFLLVTAYAKQLRLPAGNWTDFWSGERFEGPAAMPVKTTGEHGGALLVKSGAMIPRVLVLE